MPILQICFGITPIYRHVYIAPVCYYSISPAFSTYLMMWTRPIIMKHHDAKEVSWVILILTMRVGLHFF